MSQSLLKLSKAGKEVNQAQVVRNHEEPWDVLWGFQKVGIRQRLWTLHEKSCQTARSKDQVSQFGRVNSKTTEPSRNNRKKPTA